MVSPPANRESQVRKSNAKNVTKQLQYEEGETRDIASPIKVHNESQYYSKELSDYGGSTINLNLNASSKYVSVPRQSSPYQQYPNMVVPPAFIPPNLAPFISYQFESPNKTQQEYNEATDVFLLRNKIAELTQNLQRESEINKVLVPSLCNHLDSRSQMS
jgi:hypothetical protein